MQLRRARAPSSGCGSWRCTTADGSVVEEPELHELGAPARRRAGHDLVDGPAVDGELVEGELDVALDGLAGRLGPAGLEVDDDHPAVGVELEAVGVAAEPHLLAVGELDHGA